MDIADSVAGESVNKSEVKLTSKIMATMPPKPEGMDDQLYLKMCKAFQILRMKGVSPYAAMKIEHVEIDEQVKPDCEVCKGHGRVYPLDDDGKPKYNETILCPAPGCKAENWAAHTKAKILQEEESSRKGLAKLQVFAECHARKGQEEALAMAKDFAELKTDGEGRHLNLLYGTTGNGKTMLCNCAAMRLAQNGHRAMVLNVDDFIGGLKKQEIEDRERIIEEMEQLEILLIDEYKTEKHNEKMAEEVIERIINWRYQNMLFTMMTTNNEFHQLPERIQSRFIDRKVSRICHNEAADQRPKERKKEKK